MYWAQLVVEKVALKVKAWKKKGQPNAKSHFAFLSSHATPRYTAETLGQLPTNTHQNICYFQTQQVVRKVIILFLCGKRPDRITFLAFSSNHYTSRAFPFQLYFADTHGTEDLRMAYTLPQQKFEGSWRTWSAANAHLSNRSVAEFCRRGEGR